MNNPIGGIDHVAITVRDLRASIDFYARVLGASVSREFTFDGKVNVIQLRVGAATLSVHQAGHKHPLVAGQPTPGSRSTSATSTRICSS